MNKKAQEINPAAFILGVVGAVLAFIMAGQMETGLLYKLFTTLVTGVVCYFLATAIANS